MLKYRVPHGSQRPEKPLWRGVGDGGLLAGKRRRPAAEDGVPPSLQITSLTHILLARSPAPYSPFPPRRALSPTAFSGTMARPAGAPCSHAQTGPPDSATSPVIVLYSRALCARLCVFALPPSPAGFLMSAHLSRLRLFQRHLRSLVWVGVWVWDWIHSHTPPRPRSPSSRPPPFTHYPFPPRSLVCGGQPSPHKPRLVVSHSTCPPLSSSPTRTAL